ncbi:MAG TPA: hypothetical protein VHQ86_04680, partial [Candidatus Saccharimonadia bacterium]|nr:hypothetical protein [Candidatus Saccharimonadia bacterium]
PIEPFSAMVGGWVMATTCNMFMPLSRVGVTTEVVTPGEVVQQIACQVPGRLLSLSLTCRGTGMASVTITQSEAVGTSAIVMAATSHRGMADRWHCRLASGDDFDMDAENVPGLLAHHLSTRGATIEPTP